MAKKKIDHPTESELVLAKAVEAARRVLGASPQARQGWGWLEVMKIAAEGVKKVLCCPPSQRAALVQAALKAMTALEKDS